MRRGTLSDSAAQIFQVVKVTLFFLIFALSLTALMTHVVRTMIASADEIDDRHAVQTVASAINSLKSSLAATLEDNAVWDEAYASVTGPKSDSWIFDNWVKQGEPLSLYEGCLVSAPEGRLIAAYFRQETFEPEALLGPDYRALMTAAAALGDTLELGILSHEGRVFLVGAHAIRPFSAETQPGRSPVLMLVRELTPQLVQKIGDEHDVNHLRWEPESARDSVSLAIPGSYGRTVARLAWERRHPGTTIYAEVRPFVLGAVALLLFFLGSILIFGALAIRRLQAAARASRLEATHDALSGLMNRKGLMQLLTQITAEVNQTTVHTLHLLDLDGFKAVNDAWGHAVGDALIVKVGAALARLDASTIGAARLGGDEFALLERGPVNPVLIEELLSLFRRPFLIDGRPIEVGASIGSATADGSTTPSELLRRADMALYRAKETGRNRAVAYDATLDGEQLQLAAIEDALRQAIDSGAVTLEFQPLVSAADGAVAGVEALARWAGPTGPISPEVFIPLAEKAGLIEALGRRLLHLALNHARRWPTLGLSVNISPLQLCRPGFAEMVVGLLEATSFDPGRLTFEVTEAVFGAKVEQARKTMERLRAVGIRFALDDFGSGYTSIDALRRFGFERVKLDRSFIAAADAEGNGAQVLSATISLAAALNLPVTAEGVEMPHQAVALRLAGCDQLQGFLMGPPQTPEQIDRLVAASTGIDANGRESRIIG
ncbi:putative bifunctional diguanylate cyclase/phosphodiesterase [Rhizobium sp. YIM 134829]|uniref:putative bifunctional diguanylate cyclase/phosphodiesterase n=1 Tax=Rhizobium sp. YIM 134829 TaxID=3390453 RepID=UPI0039786878